MKTQFKTTFAWYEEGNLGSSTNQQPFVNFGNSIRLAIDGMYVYYTRPVEAELIARFGVSIDESHEDNYTIFTFPSEEDLAIFLLTYG